MWYIYTHAGKILIYIKIKQKKFKCCQVVVVHAFNPSILEAEAA